MSRTKIEWATDSWNPIRARNRATGKLGWHCEHVTTGCEHCYAERLNMRLGTGLPFKPGHRGDIEIFLDEDILTAPLRWRRPRMIFVCSMTDLFADFVEDRWIDKIFAIMALCPQHTFQVLTKRAERMREYLTDVKTNNYIGMIMGKLSDDADRRSIRHDHPGWFFERPPKSATPPLRNIWLGFSAEDQATLNLRWRDAGEIAELGWLVWCSAEPLLGPLDLTRVETIPDSLDKNGELRRCGIRVNVLTGRHHESCIVAPRYKLSWVVVGGESGPKARPMHPDWARSIRDQCRAADIPFFFKQRGSFTWMDEYNHDTEEIPELPSNWRERTDSKYICMRADATMADGFGGDSAEFFYCVGKKAAGRLLDGRTWNEMPLVKTAEGAA